MVRDSIATKLTNLPIGNSDRIISMRPPLSVMHATVFSVCVPTIQADPTEKENVYTDFFETFQQMTRLSSLAI